MNNTSLYLYTKLYYFKQEEYKRFLRLTAGHIASISVSSQILANMVVVDKSSALQFCGDFVFNSTSRKWLNAVWTFISYSTMCGCCVSVAVNRERLSIEDHFADVHRSPPLLTKIAFVIVRIRPRT